MGIRHVLLIAATAVVTLGSGCPLLPTAKDKNAIASRAVLSVASASGASGAAIFRTDVHPYFRKNCASCHGVSQSPMFAVPNATEAYPVAKAPANLADPSQSAFYRKVRDSHCGSNCTTDGSTLLGLLKKWAAAEKAVAAPVGAPAGTIVTQALAVPANIATFTGANYTTLRFRLEGNSPSNGDLFGVIFEVEIQQFSPRTTAGPGAYRVRRPRILTATQPVRVQGIRVMVNGKLDLSANDFMEVDSVVAPAAFTVPATAAPNNNLPFAYLSAETLLLVQDADSGDRIQFVFDKIEKGATVVACRNLNNFRNLVWPNMKTQCMGCHGTSGNTAFNRFKMVADPALEAGTSDAQGNCQRSLTRSDVNSAAQSVLIQTPLGNLSGHPVIGGFSGVQNNWIQWIQSER